MFNSEIIRSLKNDINASLDKLDELKQENDVISGLADSLKAKLKKKKNSFFKTLLVVNKKRNSKYYAWWSDEEGQVIIFSYVKRKKRI